MYIAYHEMERCASVVGDGYWRPCLAGRLRTARHVRRAVLLLEALDIHPPLQGFEALLTASGRMKE